jgi:hypothetical protein
MCGGARFRALASGLALLMASAGCAVRTPALRTYRLVKQDTGRVLIPPGIATADVPQRTFAADVVSGRGSCAPAGGPVEILPHKNRVRVTVRRDALLKQPPGWLSSWTALAESQGCIAPGEGLKLATRIVESLPLDPNAAYRLLHADDRRSGFVDLGAEKRLQVVSPILREGAAPDAVILETANISGSGNSLTVDVKSTPNLIGFETAWYAIQPKAGGIGFTISPLSAEKHIQAKTEAAAAPATNYLQFPPQAAFYRLFYKADQTDVVAVVMAAPTRAELDRQSKAFEADPSLCEKLASRMCAVFPRRVGVNPFLIATVNGSETTLPVGTTVRGAIQSAGERNAERLLLQLTVLKPYAGKPVPVEFDRASPEILSLTLSGGESISWQSEGNVTAPAH